MAGHDYIQFQNQGSILSNIRLLHELDIAKDAADSQGYYSKRDVAKVAVNSLIITSGSKNGKDLLNLIDSGGDDSRNPILQNAKARMQILRVLGFVSADYGSEVFAITPMGKLLLTQFRKSQTNIGLLREAFLNISSSTESYDHNCSQTFNCVLGYGICYALASLDYKISTQEMPLLTTYDISDIDSFVEDAKKFRVAGQPFPTTHAHFPKTSKNTPLKNPANITRSINQILRVCGIIEAKQRRENEFNYYVCSKAGKAFVDKIKRSFKPERFVTAYLFRKKNNITEQKEKSRYKDFSIWVLDDIPYDFILVESIEKKTGVLGLRAGIKRWGKFVSETFYMPAEVEGMEWDGVVKWAIEHDSIVAPPGWKMNEDGSVERDVTCSVFMGRATYR